MSDEPFLTDDDFVSPASLPGAMIDEKYRVDRVIGRGGVGLVVVATHLAMAQRVAIKMIRDDVPMQRELLDRFHREARAAAMIRSEHVARVLDVGRLPTGRPYIVMEYLEGEDLEKVIARGPVPYAAAVDLSLQACEALAEAHRAGIVHRDLKPANLFLTRRTDGAPLVKVLDFGISKIQPLTAAREGRSIETTSIMGSPGYMAPEQMRSTRDVDARADVWSLGTVLYEMLVGRPAFEGATMIEILNAIAACRPPAPSARQPGVPVGLDVVLTRCLSKEPEERYAGIAELAVALQPFASPAGAGLADRAVRISREPVPAYEEPQFSVLRYEPRPSTVTVVTPARRRLSRLRMLGAGVGGLCILAVAGFVYARRAAPSASSASPGDGVAASDHSPAPTPSAPSPSADPAAPPTVAAAPESVPPPAGSGRAPSPPMGWPPAPSVARVASSLAATVAPAAPRTTISKPPARRAPRPTTAGATTPESSSFGDRK